MTSKATCHCKAIQIEFPKLPEKVAECNCSICRRLGALWFYLPPEVVNIQHNESATHSYVWGERRIEFFRCCNCGCTTHWLPLLEDYKMMGINARMIDGLSPEKVDVTHEEFGGDGCFWR